MSILIRYEADNDTAAKEHFAGCFGSAKALKEYCLEKQDVGITCCLFVCNNLEKLESTAALINDMKNDMKLNINEMKLIIYFSDDCDKALLSRVIGTLTCNIFLVYGLKRQKIFECMAAKEHFTDLNQVCIVESAEYSPENINLSNIFYTYYHKEGLPSDSSGVQTYNIDAVKAAIDKYVEEKYEILKAADYSFLTAFTEDPYNISIKETPFCVSPESQYDAFIKKYAEVINAFIVLNIGFEQNSFALTLEKDFADTLIETYSNNGVNGIVGKDVVKLYDEFLSEMEELNGIWEKESNLCLKELREVYMHSGGDPDETDRDGEKTYLKNLKAYSKWLRTRYIEKYINYKKAETKIQTYPLVREKVIEKKRNIQAVVETRELTRLEKIFASIITNGSFAPNVLAALKNSTRLGNDIILRIFSEARPGFCNSLKYISEKLTGNTAQSENFENFAREITDFINEKFIMKPLLPHRTNITSIKNSISTYKEHTIVIAPDDYPRKLQAALNHAEDFNVSSFIKYNIICIQSSNIDSLLELISL
jgi:hypothetical protein